MFSKILSEIEAFGRLPGEVWFRGQADESWKLIPGLLRSDHGAVKEMNLLLRFRSRAMSILPNHPSDSDMARWLFLMQHHGLPTRLMDWTESALAALYFAVGDPVDKDGALYLLAPLDFNEHQINEAVLPDPNRSEVKEIFSECFQSGKQQKVAIAITGYASNDRISRQHGSFTIHGDMTDLKEILKPAFFRTLIVPAAQKRELRKQLQYFGVTRTSLFNDLDSLARDVREQFGII